MLLVVLVDDTTSPLGGNFPKRGECGNRIYLLYRCPDREKRSRGRCEECRHFPCSLLYLSGPFEITTAEPGDVLIVGIQYVQPFDCNHGGFTGVFDTTNGRGFLR